VADLKKILRKAVIENKVFPVFCGSALKNKGVQLVLDAVVDYLPSPLDMPAIKGIDPRTGEEIERHPSDSEPFSALAFKLQADPFVGQLTFFRVYSGTIESGSTFTTLQPETRKDWDVSCACKRTRGKKLKKFLPEKLPPPSDLKMPKLPTHFAMKIIL